MDRYSFYEPSPVFFCSEKSSFWSLRGRFSCLKALLEKTFFLPLAIALKLGATACRMVGLLIGFSLLVLTFGSSHNSREFFLRRVLFLAKDVAEWVVFPFHVILQIGRLIFGVVIHPVFYFRPRSS